MCIRDREKGYTTALSLLDAPVKVGNKTFHNYDHKYEGMITMRYAVQWSKNTYAVRLPVSYTHLDVYKRQHLFFKLFTFKKPSGVWPHSRQADVYKRQLKKGVYHVP